MKLTEFFLNELDREVERSRKALEQVGDGKYDWKPHEKSMAFGYLADMVATIPMWLTMQITREELDVAPAEGSQMKQTRKETRDALVKALDEAAAGARAALEKATEEHLMTNWRLLARGQVVAEEPRYLMMQDTINHWAHHRGQMTVYLRLMGAKVPALYGHQQTTRSLVEYRSRGIKERKPAMLSRAFLVGSPFA
jgi:uncharacterized damage-inducible protein DinB